MPIHLKYSDVRPQDSTSYFGIPKEMEHVVGYLFDKAEL